MNVQRSLAVVGLALTLIAPTACGGDDDDASSSNADRTPTTLTTDETTEVTSAPASDSQPANPCEVVTKEQAETLARTPLQDGVLSEGESSSCTYTGPTTGPTAQVEVFLGAGAKKFLDTDRDTLQHPFETVADLGEEAYAEDDAVFFRTDTTWVALHLVRLDDPALYKDALLGLANDMAAKLSTASGGASEAEASSGGECAVTDADVQAATGAAEVTEGAPHGGYPGATTCAWYLGDAAAGATIAVTVLRDGKSAFEQTANAPNGPDELNDGEPYETVADLGDQATASGVGGDVNLDVVQGDDWVNVTSFSYPGVDPSRETAKGLSTDALDACSNLARTILEQV